MAHTSTNSEVKYNIPWVFNPQTSPSNTLPPEYPKLKADEVPEGTVKSRIKQLGRIAIRSDPRPYPFSERDRESESVRVGSGRPKHGDTLRPSLGTAIVTDNRYLIISLARDPRLGSRRVLYSRLRTAKQSSFGATSLECQSTTATPLPLTATTEVVHPSIRTR